MKLAHRIYCLAAAGLMLTFVSIAGAQQSYPAKPVRLIIPFPPGGGNDFVGRLAAQKLGERLGQQFIPDNRPGASGVIGTEIAARAVPDGYTLLLGFVGPLALNPNLEKVPYDPVRDFTAASLIASSYHILVVHPSVPARSVKELVALARSRPGALNYASSGSGANFHLIAELFKSTARVDILHVPYKGAAAAALAVVTGEAHMMFSSTTAVLPHMQSQRLAALAVTSPKRSPLVPGVPTLSEAGLSGVELGSWYAIVAPAATPREIVGRLNSELVKLAAVPDYRQQLEKLAFEPLTSKPEDFPAFVQAEIEKWGKVIRNAGIKPD